MHAHGERAKRQPDGRMSDWRRSKKLAVPIMLVIAMIQLGIPTSLVGAEDQPRFGWQMFSMGDPLPAFEVVKETGSERVDLDDYMARVRDEIDAAALLPPHLCEVVPGATRIVWDKGEWPC